MAIGTSTIHDGRLVGGSIQPMDDIGLVRVIAFGEAGPAGDRLDEFHRLCGMVNPLLVDTTFEVDTDLAMPVCRVTVRVTGDDAAAGGEPIGMAHIVPAMADEFRKQGRLVDPASFGRHRSFLDTTS